MCGGWLLIGMVCCVFSDVRAAVAELKAAKADGVPVLLKGPMANKLKAFSLLAAVGRGEVEGVKVWGKETGGVW